MRSSFTACNEPVYWNHVLPSSPTDSTEPFNNQFYADCDAFLANSAPILNENDVSISHQPFSDITREETPGVPFFLADEFEDIVCEVPAPHFDIPVSRSMPDLSERLKSLVDKSFSISTESLNIEFASNGESQSKADNYPATEGFNGSTSQFQQGNASTITSRIKDVQSCPNLYLFQGQTLGFPHHQHQMLHYVHHNYIPRLKNTTILGSREEIIRFNLQSLAQAFATLDQENINHYYSALQVDSSPTGTAVERLAHYSMQSLIVRYNGTGAECCKNLAMQPGNPLAMHSFFKRLFSEAPVSYLSFLAKMDEIFELCHNSTALLHFVDILGYPASWCPYLKLIRMRFNRVIRIKITLVVFVDENIDHSDKHPEAALPSVQAYAESIGFSPVFRIIRGRLRDFKLAELKCAGELLVVSCGSLLGQLPDSSVLNSNPRDNFIQMMSEAEPDLILVTQMNFNLNTQFFLKRFSTAMDLGFFLLTMLERVYSNLEELLIVERSILIGKVINAVACEGLDRYMRFEEYKTLRLRFLKAGFALKPISSAVLQNLQREVKRFGPDMTVDSVDGAMHLFWNGAPITFHSSWRMKK